LKGTKVLVPLQSRAEKRENPQVLLNLRGKKDEGVTLIREKGGKKRAALNSGWLEKDHPRTVSKQGEQMGRMPGEQPRF